MKNFGEFLNFVQIFYKVCDILKKSLMSTFLLNVPRTEILATPLQYKTLEVFMYKFCPMFPEPKSWRRLCLAPPSIFGPRKPVPKHNNAIYFVACATYNLLWIESSNKLFRCRISTQFLSFDAKIANIRICHKPRGGP